MNGKAKEPMTEQKHHEDGRYHVIDFSDPQVVAAWLVEVDTDLDESDRQALAEEISRQFRRSPAGVPASRLERELERTQERLSWVLQQLETQESPEVRSQVGQLRERFVNDIESLKKRVDELQLQDPES
jgi:acetolactate synthase small subunit